MDITELLTYLQPVIDLFGTSPYMRAIMVFVIALAFANLLALILAKVVKALALRTKNSLDDAITAILHGPFFWTVILMGLLAALSILHLPATPDRIAHALIISLLIVIWSLFAGRLLRILIKTMSERAKHHSFVRPQTLPLFNNLILVIVVALAMYLVFQTWNIDMTAWVTSAGIVGIAIGFAAKDTLANLFSGVFILADTPYKIGDYVVLDNGDRGKVTHIGIRSTRLLTRDDVEVTIPNSIMGNTRIINESGGPYEKYRIRVKVGVAYGSDIDQVRQVLLDVAAAEPLVCENPEPRVRFRTFGNSGLDFELLSWIEQPELRGRALDELNSTVYKRFMTEGIEIPYAKQDVYIKELPGERSNR